MDYKVYIKHFEKALPKSGRGFRARISRKINCQSAYVSQVLKGSNHFSLEQAEALNSLLGHQDLEAKYFLFLVEWARAGTPSLKNHFLSLIEEIREKNQNLKEKFKVKETLTLQDQMKYYSEWLFTATHIATTIPNLKTREDISRFLGIPSSKMSEVLEFLEKTELIKRDDNQYSIGEMRTHVGSESPLVNNHHKNWRWKAIQSLDDQTQENFHYTSVVSLAEKDVQKIKNRFIKEIDQYRSIIKESPEETLQCFTLDFFPINNRLRNK